MMDEGELSDASLIEDDEDSSETIDLPGVPITAPASSSLEPFQGFPPIEEQLEDLDNIIYDDEDLFRPFAWDFNTLKLPAYKLVVNLESSFNTTTLKVKGKGSPASPSPTPDILAAGSSSRKKKKLSSPHVSITPATTTTTPASSTGTKSTIGRRESREWKPSSQYFKPLYVGWVREVVYSIDMDTGLRKNAPPSIYYHSPYLPGRKSRTFRHAGELDSFRKMIFSTLKNY